MGDVYVGQAEIEKKNKSMIVPVKVFYTSCMEVLFSICLLMSVCAEMMEGDDFAH